MALRRIFAAIEISEAARGAAAAYAENLRARFGDVHVRWERPEKFHMTLRFEAKADGPTLSDLETKLRLAAQRRSRFEMVLSGTGALTNRRGPAVLWLGVDTHSCDILSSIAQGLKDQGRFHPHLTIARIKDPGVASDLVDHHRNASFGPIAFLVNELVLIESTLTPAGSVYNVILREPLP